MAIPPASVALCSGNTVDGDIDNFAIRQECWAPTPSDAKGMHRELAGITKVEVVSLSDEKVEATF